jgi:hypothetical protein
MLVAIGLFLAALAGWEAYWRAERFVPSARNSAGLWALTRDRLDREGPGGTVIVGSSRAMFDLHLEAWREETGGLPVQLALEGTNPRPFLRHVAQDTTFSGVVVVGVTEVLFFPPVDGLRAEVLAQYRDRTPADRLSQRISMHVVEPYLAFYDPDTALFALLRRQRFWPARRNLTPQLPVVRKLANSRRTRQADMWNKVEQDPAYRQIVRDTWLEFLNAPRPPAPPPEVMKQQMQAVLDDVADQVRAIRARGGDVVFLRLPSTGPFREAEHGGFPRERAWDPLLARADAAGVHFEDHPDLQDVELPEWSHIRADQTDRFTRALVARIRQAFEARGTPRRELGQ